MADGAGDGVVGHVHVDAGIHDALRVKADAAGVGDGLAGRRLPGDLIAVDEAGYDGVEAHGDAGGAADGPAGGAVVVLADFEDVVHEEGEVLEVGPEGEYVFGRQADVHGLTNDDGLAAGAEAGDPRDGQVEEGASAEEEAAEAKELRQEAVASQAAQEEAEAASAGDDAGGGRPGLTEAEGGGAATGGGRSLEVRDAGAGLDGEEALLDGADAADG